MSFKCLVISEVEDLKWANLLEKSANASFYMCLDYLKLMHPKWLVFVSIKGDDYEFALPIPVKGIGFFQYGMQPVMLQRLSFLSQSDESSEGFMQYAAQMIRKKLIYFRLNFDTQSYSIISKYLNVDAQSQINLNCVIDKEGSVAYSTNHKRNIQKAKKQGLKFSLDENTKPVFEGFLNEKIEELKISKKKFKHVEKMISRFTESNQLKAVHALDANNNRMAACLMFLFRDTATFILSYSNEKGKKMGAMHGIIDYWMTGFGQNYRILDFEGGRIDNLKRFYLGFGAKEEKYIALRFYHPILQAISRLTRK